MVSDIEQLFDNNRQWAARRIEEDPDFFQRLARQQSPEYLWIGCSDSRVPANQIIDLDPGEVFVHRNIANVVVHTDLNALSVIQFAVDVLRVKHVLVVGHYGCGGVAAAMDDAKVGLVENWLRHVQDVRDHNIALLDALEAPAQRRDRLCELNVMQQVVNISHNSVMREAWARGQKVTLHGWCYSLQDGLIRDLGMSSRSREEADGRFMQACERMRSQL
ncbi:carbonate dehydratase [Pseudazoarcus pumilus]|uniref:carbonate dehydratase n=1 Tax=Pseudazoarcus pumilus TaxID=2067960 RepID=UPI0018F884C4|nr:carbonate dehydratase [Pseudazoarcus pumilus]